MFSIKIKYFLYGIITSVSLISIVTYAASGPDGVFGDYFTRMTGLCASNSVVTWFQTGSLYGKQECITIGSLVGSLDIFNLAGNIWIGTAMPTSKLDVNGKIQSELTVIWDSDRTVTTKSYVDNWLKWVCIAMGWNWIDIFKICSSVPVPTPAPSAPSTPTTPSSPAPSTPSTPIVPSAPSAPSTPSPVAKHCGYQNSEGTIGASGGPSCNSDSDCSTASYSYYSPIYNATYTMNFVGCM